ncbi:hypothetical protein AFLA70_247g001931 [Aspergillus flavus AF70]|nr:hypothetical protein AFLA70_247g001931 [Aspergillus flavus AF70]
MALDSKSFQPLDIKLSGPHDDEEDIFFKDLLLSLVGGEITPNEAANNLDKWIVEKSNTDLEERKKYPDPWNVPSPENPSWVAPNPSGLITCFFESFALLCSAFPPGHVGQDRLIRFLEALRDMPKHEVPNYLPNDPPEDFYYLLELWPFGGSWLGLTEVFRTEAEGTFFAFTGSSSLNSTDGLDKYTNCLPPAAEFEQTAAIHMLPLQRLEVTCRLGGGTGNQSWHVLQL